MRESFRDYECFASALDCLQASTTSFLAETPALCLSIASWTAPMPLPITSVSGWATYWPVTMACGRKSWKIAWPTGLPCAKILIAPTVFVWTVAGTSSGASGWRTDAILPPPTRARIVAIVSCVSCVDIAGKKLLVDWLYRKFGPAAHCHMRRRMSPSVVPLWHYR